MTHYPVGVTTYNSNSIVDVEYNKRKGDVVKVNPIESASGEITINEDNSRRIMIFYSTTGIKVSTTSLRVDLNTFVSNVGGSLGLFIGFSVLGGFFFVYDVISSKIELND